MINLLKIAKMKYLKVYLQEYSALKFKMIFKNV